MDSFTKRVLRIPLDKPFEEAYFTHKLWMFFWETKETEQDIHRIFYQIREKMKQRITMKKKSDPEKFAVPCLVNGIKFPCAVLHRFISQHTTQGNGRTSGSEDRAFGGFIHFCGPFYENSKESSEILRCRLAMH